MSVDDDIWDCAKELLMGTLAQQAGKDKEAEEHMRAINKYPIHIVKTAKDQLGELIKKEQGRRAQAELRRAK